MYLCIPLLPISVPGAKNQLTTVFRVNFLSGSHEWMFSPRRLAAVKFSDPRPSDSLQATGCKRWHLPLGRLIEAQSWVDHLSSYNKLRIVWLQFIRNITNGDLNHHDIYYPSKIRSLEVEGSKIPGLQRHYDVIKHLDALHSCPLLSIGFHSSSVQDSGHNPILTSLFSPIQKPEAAGSTGSSFLLAPCWPNQGRKSLLLKLWSAGHSVITPLGTN